jgi:hypothetical protein
MYLIRINGKVVTASTWDGVVRWIRDRHPNAEIGHDGDMEDGGDCTIAWVQTDEQAAAGEGQGTPIATITHVDDADD